MYQQIITAKWSDIDANGHMKNTAYSEYATHVRFSFFAENGFNLKRMEEHEIGPVILREESTYYREVRLLEKVTVTCELYQASLDYSRFHFVQNVIKENNKRAARLRIDAIWLDLRTRKTTPPIPALLEVCQKIPKTNDFQWIDSTIRYY